VGLGFAKCTRDVGCKCRRARLHADLRAGGWL